MSVRTRLTGALVLMAVLLGIPALYTVSRLGDVRDTVVAMSESQPARVALARLETQLVDLHRVVETHAARPGSTQWTVVDELLGDIGRKIERLHGTAYAARYAGGLDALEERFHSLETAARRSHRLALGSRDEAAAVLLGTFRSDMSRVRHSLRELTDAVERRDAAAARRVAHLTSRAETTSLAAVIVALASAVVLAVWITRSLVPPLDRLRRAMAAAAGGRISAPRDLPYTRRDEVGDLSRSFRTMADRLIELGRMRAEFLSMTSHDLKTPISVIHSYAEILAHGTFGPVTDRQRGVLETIQEQTRLLTASVNRLVDTGRVEAHGFRVETEEVDTHAFFDDVRYAFGALARHENIDFDVRVYPSAPPTISLDPVRMRNEVLGNLLSNAFKFTPPGGRVAVAVYRAADDGVAIEVADTGSGMQPDQLPRIFDTYYQARGESRGLGAGLGLAIVRQVVRAHGGRIDVQSEPDAGTVFNITLPGAAHREAHELRRIHPGD